MDPEDGEHRIGCAYCHGSVSNPLWHHLELWREDPGSSSPWPEAYDNPSFCCQDHLAKYLAEGMLPPPDFSADQAIVETWRDKAQAAAFVGGIGLVLALAVVGGITLVRWLV